MKPSTGDAHSFLHRISHKRIDPPPLTGQTPLPQMIEEVFLSYNAGRLREACRLFAHKMLAEDTVVGLSLSGALTAAAELATTRVATLVLDTDAGFIRAGRAQELAQALAAEYHLLEDLDKGALIVKVRQMKASRGA